MKKQRFKDTVIRQDHKDDGENEYTYQLIMREGAKVASYKIPLYSVKVVMTDSSGESTSASVKDVFADAGKAISFYDRIVSGLATPIDLRYIIEDEMN